MPLGPAVRRLFGRHEHRIAALYRAIFVDIDAYARQIGEWVPAARRILEVGCGEGAVTERLVHLYPAADILAIDITPRVGRLFRGPHEHVTFKQVTVQQVAADAPGAFDLVILSDVLHHVPAAMRGELLAAVHATVAPGGALIFKDWERTAAPIHWLCHAGDRWLTGDRVRYLRRPEAETLLADAFGRPAVIARAFVKPWRNNFALLARA
ncbi:MAG TPA: class I SAM-dependent methyltransferase [Xanthobacteraceae bacterium]|nr:class I SAM-dependent methyltransferase [Xanthobacteraceae bacterium]